MKDRNDFKYYANTSTTTSYPSMKLYQEFAGHGDQIVSVDLNSNGMLAASTAGTCAGMLSS